jgi:homoserine kinase
MRGLLKPEISRADAVFNIQRVALLVDSLHRGDLTYLVTATQDMLHQVRWGRGEGRGARMY